MARKGIGSQLSSWIFDRIHRSTIVFNDAREDPVLDRVALDLRAEDRMMVITSAGCNVLDYLLCGVPPAQRRQIERGFPGGVSAFIQSRLDNVFTKISLVDNYHWRIYMFGRYTPECCPEYLKPDNFERLKAGAVDRVAIHTDSVSRFLARVKTPISKFVLLDHLDWLADKDNPELIREWQAIVDCAAPNARVIWRSGGLESDFVNRVRVEVGGSQVEMGHLLDYRSDLARALHERDRVQTYGSFHIAEFRRDSMMRH